MNFKRANYSVELVKLRKEETIGNQFQSSLRFECNVILYLYIESEMSIN